jgi:diguanylate cyclase (GGDEF)-like protein/PAS domain S-box-containing protein
MAVEPASRRRPGAGRPLPRPRSRLDAALWLLLLIGLVLAAGAGTVYDEEVLGAALAVVLLLAFALAKVMADSRHELRNRFEAIVQHSPAGIFVRDRDGRFVHANPALHGLLELGPGTVVGRHVGELFPARTGDRALDGDRRVLLGELVGGEETITVGGRDRFLEVLKFPVTSASGQRQVCGIVTDVTERRRLEQHVAHLADHDALTGLYNRNRLVRELDRQLRYAARSGRPGALLLIDLDNFAAINDSRGRAAGDDTLCRVAATLSARLRHTDLVARSGGNEFAVLLPEASESQAMTVASQLSARLSEVGPGLPLEVSIGIAAFGGAEATVADDLLACADIALHEAKRGGGDSARTYRGAIGGAIGWVKRIEVALASDGLVLYGLPIIDVRTGEVAYNELLLRMVDDQGALIAPSEFLPVAERVGLIGKIDAWVTREGLRLALAGARVTINLSARSIGRYAIVDEALAAIARGLEPDRVVFEITETAALRNVASAQEFATQLRDMGFRLALDDFGTGFASLSYLRMLPIDLIKIDIDFIRDLADRQADRAVVKAIVELAHALGKQTVAEGVENADTAAAVRELGVDFAQGFHYEPPRRLSPPTMSERLRRTRGSAATAVVPDDPDMD